ncbi:TonB-dependent receptor [Dyadobacter sp. CY323]|uniref:SusC/RagA family TonB-linked outer membrane protein n=1 Tax=Dyadobacter sp. CY323 TaxID=2907302 RepID=UPI001F2F0B2A|nr:TonB-dependent receptor [Dyadobacter sp. CY323]MCE6989828.1 TonB-dependent receptor [Dyadobacter sp. CY323]
MKNYLQVLLSGVLFLSLTICDSSGSERYVNGEKLLTVIQDINKRYHVHFTYDREIVENISIRKDYNPDDYTSANEALSSALEHTRLKYKILDSKYVIIYQDDKKGMESLKKMVNVLQEIIDQKKGGNTLPNVTRPAAKEKVEIVPPTVARLSISVSGKVQDEKGEGLPGVSILIKGSQQGTVTDVNGNFSVDVADESSVLVFSFVGYHTREVVVGNKSTIEISLSTDQKSFDEVVVVGYGSQKKSDLTGAVSSVNLEAFKEAPNINILQSLQGSVPGVRIGQVNQAGQEPSIMIRGQNTLSGSTSPLIVVDGIIFRGRLSDLNPADIKSVDVLKDASSKAIYGAQAANGVIIITTNSGKSAKKPVISYSGSYSIQNPSVNARLLDREETLQKVKAIDYKNAYLAPDYVNPNPNWNFSLSELRPMQIEGIEKQNNFDWWDALTNAAYINDHQLSIAGSTESTSYYLSGGLTDQRGYLLNDKYKRATVRVNLETNINPWLTVGVNTFGSFLDMSGKTPAIGAIASGTSPLSLPWDEQGNFIVNPRGDVAINPFLDAQTDDKDISNRASGNFYGIIKLPFLEGFSYRMNYSNNLRWWNRSNSNPYDRGQTGSVGKEHGSILDMLFDNIFTYDKKIGQHGINLTFVAGYNKIAGETTNAGGYNIPNISLGYNNIQQATTMFNSSSAHKESSVYQMIRANYNYRGRYMLTATLRRDGFSGFAKNNKTALFPSIGGAWTLSEESFFSIPVISYAKLRASYGENGNQIARYNSLARVATTTSSSYVFGDGATTSLGQSPSSLANDNLAWESTAGVNLGVDYGIFNDRIKGSVDYYKTVTTNLFWNVGLPIATGFSSITSNLGRLVNHGFEFQIFGKAVHRPKFSWDVDLNFSSNRNKITELLGVDKDGDGRDDDLIASGLFIGNSIGTVYDFETNGIWQLSDEIPAGFSPGTYRMVDQNGDGQLSAEKDRRILGRTEPAYQMGIQNTLKYSNFSFRFFINTIQGGKNAYLGANHPTGVNNTKSTAQHGNWFSFYDYWSPSNPNGKYPLVWEPAQIAPVRYVSRSFARLQDVSLSYQLPIKLLSKIRLKSANLYLSGKNMVTLTKWDGWDPETGQGVTSSNPLPVMKAYTVGLNVSL